VARSNSTFRIAFALSTAASLGIAGATLSYRNNRLYQVKTTPLSPGGQAEVDAMRFEQSLDLTYCSLDRCT
jgi:hypothetical protein